jgi:hypothetical protein
MLPVLSWKVLCQGGLPDGLFKFRVGANDNDTFLATCDCRVHVLPRLIAATREHVHNIVSLAPCQIWNILRKIDKQRLNNKLLRTVRSGIQNVSLPDPG